MNVVKEICDRMAVMQDGRVVEEGPVYEIFSAPQAELTKEFISSVVSFDVPQTILDQVTGRIVKVMFKGNVAGEGVISDTVQQFDVRGNFLHGAIEYIQEVPLGLFLMEIQGQPDNINRAITYMEGRGAQVEVIRNGN
jgi:D-methionine transport system ATP-binding protein